MTTYEKTVRDICDGIYYQDIEQILIDLVQEVIEPLFHPEQPLTLDDIGAASYQTSILLEAYNPALKKGFEILTVLDKAMDDWSDDFEATNKILGIEPNK